MPDNLSFLVMGSKGRSRDLGLISWVKQQIIIKRMTISLAPSPSVAQRIRDRKELLIAHGMHVANVSMQYLRLMVQCMNVANLCMQCLRLMVQCMHVANLCMGHSMPSGLNLPTIMSPIFFKF